MLLRSVVEFTGPTAHVHSFPRPAREQIGGHGLGRRRGGRSSRSRPGRGMGHGRLLPSSGVGRPHRRQPMLTDSQDQRVCGPARTDSADEQVGAAAADAAPAAAWATDTCCRGAWWSSRGRQLMFTASQDQRVSKSAGTASADEGVGEAAEAALAAAWATDACCRVAGWGGHTADSPCSQTLRISACADRRGTDSDTWPTSSGVGERSSRCRPGRRMGHGHMLPRSVVEFTGPTAHAHSFPRPARVRTGEDGLGRRRGIGAEAADAAPAAAWATDTCCRGAWWSSGGRQLMFTASQDQRVSGLAGTASADEGVGEAAEAALAAAWATDACCRVAGWGGHTADSPCSQTLRISACADRRGRTRLTGA